MYLYENIRNQNSIAFKTTENHQAIKKPHITYFKYIADKIKSKYFNTEIKIKISIILQILKTILKDCIECIETLQQDIRTSYKDLKETYFTDDFEFEKKAKYKNPGDPDYYYMYGMDHHTWNNLKYRLCMKIREIRSKSTKCYCLFTDIYTIRRIIDKPYCTNTILYVGDSHAWIILFLLTTHFDFKITHASHSTKSMAELNQEIKDQSIESDESKNKWYTRHLNPPVFQQCCSMEGFPDMFF